MEPAHDARRQVDQARVEPEPYHQDSRRHQSEEIISVTTPSKHTQIVALCSYLLMLPALLLTLVSCAGGGPSVCTAMAAMIPGAALTVRDGVVYGNRGKVFALRASDGAVLWQTADARAYKAAAPVVDGQSVIVSAGIGVVTAWRASDGASLWRSRPISDLSAPSPDTPDPLPVVADGVVYAAAGYGTLAAWDERDGHTLWVSHVAPDAEAEQTYTGNNSPLPRPVVAGITVYASAGRSIYALRAADGSVLWQLPTAPVGITYATPIVAANTVYVPDSNGTVLALDAETGAVRWRAQGNTSVVARPPLSVVVQGQIVFASSGGDTVRALSATTGAVLWRYVTGEAHPEYVGRLSPPVLSGSQVYVSSITGLYVVDAATGRQLWRAALDPSISGGAAPMDDAPIPVADQESVFIVTGHGVEVWRATDGRELWYTHRSEPGGQSAVAAGTAYLTQWGLTAPCGGDPTLPRVFALRGADGTRAWQASI